VAALPRHALSLALALLTALSASHARADGKRDLEDGIAFYENLDTDRATERLKAASIAGDLDAPSRAKAFLYLGMLEFETGARVEAQSSWKKAFALDLGVSVPAGTSPKTIEAIESARKSASTEPAGSGAPSGEPKTEPAKPPQTKPPPRTEPKPLPSVTPPPKPEQAVTTTPPQEESSGDSTWIWLVVGGAVAVIGAGVAIYFATKGGDCRESGGCLTINVH
jgi:hypothetical protein